MNNIIGQQFGRLTVLKQDGYHYFPSGKRKVKWLCKCICGNEVSVITSDLTSGHTQSCGCFRKDKTASMHTKHGKSYDKLYKVWCAMKTRCSNQNTGNYSSYGARGISVCEEWLYNFDAFYEWSMSNGYKNGLTIDRIDVNGDYSPSNCRWVPFREQGYNKTNTRYVTYRGKTKSLAEWANDTGLAYSCLLYRLDHGWDIEKALTTPSKNAKGT